MADTSDKQRLLDTLAALNDQLAEMGVRLAIKNETAASFEAEWLPAWIDYTRKLLEQRRHELGGLI